MPGFAEPFGLDKTFRFYVSNMVSFRKVERRTVLIQVDIINVIADYVMSRLWGAEAK